MSLDEVLALDMEIKSIKKIDLFLSHQKQTSYEYVKALGYKCLIWHKEGKIKEALKALLTMTPLIPSMQNEAVVSLCDALIDIFIDIKNNEQAIKYIEIKKDYLKVIDSDKYLYDMIRYNMMVGNNSELKRTITLYLAEDISDERRMEALEILIKFQAQDHEYEGFDNTYKRLEGFYINNFMFDKLSKIKIQRSKNFWEQHLYDDLEHYINTYISGDTSSIDLKVIGAKYLIEIYLLKGESRRAMILESEYHELYQKASLEVQLEFVDTARREAEAIHDRFSIDEYDQKYDEIEEAIVEQKKALRKERKKTVSINIVEDEVEEVVKNEKIVIHHTKPERELYEESPTMMVEPTLIEISSNYKSIEAVLSTLSTRENVKFREILRNYGMEIDKKFSECEIVIAMSDGAEGYHYKKERVYEKLFDDIALKGTASLELIENSRKLYIVDVSTSLFDKNIITGKPYTDEFKTLIGFTLTRNDRRIGSIVYLFKTNDFEDKLIYETLRMLTQMLLVQLNKSLDYKDQDKVTRAKNYIYDMQSGGVKIEIDHLIELNQGAMDLFGIKHKKIEASEYVNLIDARDAKNYKEVYSAIYNRECNEAELFYHINNKYIKEEITVDRSDITRIYSVISDMSMFEKREQKLLDKLYYDDTSKLKTKSLLFEDIKKILDTKKFALAIIAVKNYKMFRDIYGYEFVSDLTKLLGRELLKLENNEMTIYHLEDDEFVVLFKAINDLRSVKSKVLKILDTLKSSLVDFNYRLKVALKAGIFRYTKAMRILDISKIISFASEGLIDAMEDEDDISVYDSDSVAMRFKESQKLLYISEAIDNREIPIYYKQVCNLKSDEILFYMPRLNLKNFDIEEEYFETVIQKRGIAENMDRYILKEVLNEMKTFHSDSSLYFKVIIPIHRSTISSKMFPSYLERYLKFYKIPSELITFVVKNDSSSSIERTRVQLIDKNIKLFGEEFDFTIKNNLHAYICDVNQYDLPVIDALNKACGSLSLDFIAKGITDKDTMKKVSDAGITMLIDEVDIFTVAELIKLNKA